jgi:hypothetical protein
MPWFSRFYLLIYSKLSYLSASHNSCCLIKITRCVGNYSVKLLEEEFTSKFS